MQTMQPNEDQCAVDSLLHPHSAAIEQVRMLCRSPGRHWIHQQSCEALASIYKQALQKLTNILSAPLLSHQLSASHLHLLLQPALDMVLTSILHGKRFIESCRPPLPHVNAAAISTIRRGSLSVASSLESTYSRGSSASSYDIGEDAPVVFVSGETTMVDVNKAWLVRALLKGHASSDAMDVHLHEFLIAFSAVSAAIEDFSAQFMAQISRSRIIIDQAPSPDLFWKDQSKPHVLLVSAQQLDHVKHHDETVLNSQLEQARSIGDCLDDGITTQQNYADTASFMAADDAAQLAAFLKAKMGCTKRQAFQESLDLCRFLDINKLERVKAKEESFFWTSIHKVMWLGRQFALKEYKKSMEDAFLQEANIRVRLHHPNVVHAVALFKGERTGYGILMELLDETLDTFLEAHASSLRLQEKVNIMLQIAKGMAYVHERGLIHRDLKPSNVLIRRSIDTKTSTIPQIEVKVADFGESRLRLPNSSSFRTKRVETTMYQAPEVLNNDKESLNIPLSCNKSADVYSFAMMCFKLLTEKEPFHDADKRKALSDQVIMGERPSLESISDVACPPYLKHCLKTWWAEDPQTRHSFTHICCILRHLYMCLARCQRDTEPITQFPFLGWPFSRWKKAQDIAHERLDQFETRRSEDDWKDKGYLCESTRVNEIPYEMYVMNWAIKKAANEPDEAIAVVSNAQSQDIATETHPENTGSIESHVPRQEYRRLEPSPPQLVDAKLDQKSVGNTRSLKLTSAAPHATDSSRTSDKSFGQKLKEFCCFSASITPSNHEAFHKDLRRRN